MADEPTNDNTKQARFWVEHLPVNDSYVALFGDKLETASRIPLRHPEIPALGKKRNVATPMEQQYGHERWEQLPKEQTLFSTLEEIDATLEKSGLWRDPETNDIVSIENRPRTTEQSTLPESPSERLMRLRQATELPKLHIDNPGGNWLKSKLSNAEEDYRRARKGTYSQNLGSPDITGYFLENLNLSPQLLKDFPGAAGEEEYRHDPYYKLPALKRSIEESGYSPSPILIHIREDGQPFVVEGNHRIVEAVQSGRSSIPVELKYLRGAESAEGPLSPDRLREVLQPPTEHSTLPQDPQENIDLRSLSERFARLRQAAGDIPIPEEGAAAEPPPTTALAPRPNLPAVVPKQDRPGRGSFAGALGKRLPLVQLAQAARQGWELLPEETKADARDIFSSMNEPDPFGLELGLPEEEIVEKINQLGDDAWNWIERQFGAGEPEQEPTGIATLEPGREFDPFNIFKTSEYGMPESIGQVTDQIDKKVGRTSLSLRPSEFLQLAEELDPNTKSSADRIQSLEDAIRDSRAIAPPWLSVEWVPEKSAWKVLGHEGRHRVTAGEKVFGDENLPVHLFLRNSSDDGRLGRRIEVDQLSPEMQQALENRRFIPEEGEEIVGFPEPTGIATLEKSQEARRAYDKVTGTVKFDTFTGLAEKVRAADSPDLLREVVQPNIDDVRELTWDLIPGDRGATDGQIRNMQKQIYTVTQQALSEFPDTMTVYRIGDTRSGEVVSFTVDPNFTATNTLPWVTDPDAPLVAYTVAKADILAAPNANLSAGKGTDYEQEVLINSDNVTVLEQEPTGMAEGGLVHGPLSVNPDVLEYGMRRTPAERLMRPPRTLYAEGGLASLPKNPVLGGQQHMLAYITPEEASTLRAQGGGVTPDGGQRRGPGGIASFPFGAGGVGHGVSTAAFGGHSSMGNLSVDPYSMMTPPKTPQLDMQAENTAQALAEVADTNFSLNVAEVAAKAEKSSEIADEFGLLDAIDAVTKTPRGLMADEARSKYAAIKSQVFSHPDFTPDAISHNNALQAAISQDPDGFFGPHGGWVDANGNEFSLAEVAAMSSADAMGLIGDPGTSTNLDPKSPFASALGLAQFGLGFAVPQVPFGLVSLMGDTANMLSGKELSGIPSVISGLSSEVGDIVDLPEFSFADVLGKDADQAISDAYSAISDTAQQAFAPVQSAVEQAYSAASDVVSPIAQSLGFHSEPSPFSVTPDNMGPGIEQPQAAAQPLPPLPIDHIGPLGTEVQDPLGGDIYESGLISPAFTIDELREYGIGQIPPTTSIFPIQKNLDQTEDFPTFSTTLPIQLFAHGGFVDKPLYSRN